jgi:hypothetical protein
MGWFGKVVSGVGNGFRKFGEIGKEALSKFGAVKHAYNNINSAFGNVISNSINSIPVAGPILKSIGQYLDRKETFKQLEGVLDRSRVYGKDFEKLGNRLEHG